MTQIPPETVFNINELKWWLNEFMPLKGTVLAEVIACLDDYSALKAENERLKDEHDKRRVEYMDAIATMRQAKLKAEAALQPKVVTQEWVDGFIARLDGAAQRFPGSCAIDFEHILRALGIEVCP